MKGILAGLKDQYDFIILDAPPALPLADMHIMVGLADLVVLVIRAGLTPRNVVERAVHTLGNSGDKMCIILNEVETSRLPYYMEQAYESQVE
jgi:Mrp family chromosome partitioning ATPase